jgi:DNA helicase HerA-like ATPase
VNDFEKLGAFYLGQPSAEDGALRDEPLLLESQRLVTHGLCLGMTGSGKTGLCIALLEEAAIDGVPVLAIDPKGDLGNLLLTYPRLDPAELEPWVDPDEAARRGLTTRALAEERAAQMRAGLAESGQDPERIARLAASADFAIYTPGTNAGLNLSILRSLELPPPAVRDDDELLRERVGAVVSGLLSMLGESADPLNSREHVLMSKLVHEAFARGESLSLGSLLKAVQSPPFAEVGVLDLETFFPAKERMELVRALNNLIASPAFSGFLSGEPLDVQRLLYTREGKPRVSVVSLAHLDDKQRMFVVTLLLNEVLAWVRAQPGTSSLRALLYMDEVFGYFPPVAEPPAKRPMLSLLKQARAFGLGVVLATQNPVDLDYKGLANIGTWFIGRLQTARDRARVLDGLGSAAEASGGRLDRDTLDLALQGLAPRTFLLHSARGGAPVRFRSRFALSLLRGPLTRAEIKRVMDAKRAVVAAAQAAVAPATPAAIASAVQHEVQAVPVLPSGITTFFLAAPPGATRYAAHAFALVKTEPASGPARTALVHAPIGDGVLPVDFEAGVARPCDPDELARTQSAGLDFAPLPAAALDPKRYAGFAKEAAAYALGALGPVKLSVPALKLESLPDEDESAFRVRVQQAAREQRDEAVAVLREKAEKKLERIAAREAQASARLRREEAEATQHKLSSALDVGGVLLGALFGGGLRKSDLSRASRAAQNVARAGKEHGDVGDLTRELEAIAAERAALEAELAEAIAALPQPRSDEPLTRKVAKLKKAELTVLASGLLFVPGASR